MLLTNLGGDVVVVHAFDENGCAVWLSIDIHRRIDETTDTQDGCELWRYIMVMLQSSIFSVGF